MNNQKNKMLCIKEMSDLTGMAPTTIYHKMKKNELPWEYYQITKAKRVSKLSDVLAWMESVRVLPCSKKEESEVK